MTQSENIHASAVAMNQKAVLILGRSGSGKSRLLLSLLAWGFEFISDDIVTLFEAGDEIMASLPQGAIPRFEVRGIGIHEAHSSARAPVALVVDLDEAPSERLPETKYYHQFDKKIPKLSAKGFTSLEQYLYLVLNKKITLQDLDHI